MKTKTIALLFIFCVSIMQAIGQGPGTRLNASNSGFLSNGLNEIYSVTGNYTLSADGAGSVNNPFTIDVNKPSGATVEKAYFMAASTGFSGYNVPDNCILLNGTGIAWDVSIPNGISSNNHYADVTSIIGPFIDAAGAGISSLSVDEWKIELRFESDVLTASDLIPPFLFVILYFSSDIFQYSDIYM